MKKILDMAHVWAHYDGAQVLEDVSFSLYENDFLGIIGPNGGGKTTLLKLIMGLIKPSKGAVFVFDTTPEKARKYLGYVPQHLNFDKDFPISVWELVLTGRLAHTTLFRRYSDEDKKAAEEALRKVSLLEMRERQIGTLSGGQRQRVLIARALATQPKLLLLDEPTANVDPSMAESFYDLLAELKKETAIIMVSHDISAVSVHVDKIACLNRKLYYHGSKEITQEDVDAAYECPVQLIAHGVPHRVLQKHEQEASHDGLS